VEIFVGIVAMVVTTAALTPTLGEQGAHVVGSLAFGIGLRPHHGLPRRALHGELPDPGQRGARPAQPASALPRMWLITLALNLVA
jgi:hypothetical protein